MTLPNFLIIGAPKCGTTALYHYLSEHPRIFMSIMKEPHFFADDLRVSNYVRSESAYGELFRGAGPRHRAVGEASVCYLFSDVAAAKIRATLPHVKIVVMFRRPEDLFVSWHNQTVASLFEEERDPEAAWRLQEARRRGEQIPDLCEEPRFLVYEDVCRVGAQFRRWLDLFPREQVHGIVFDDFKQDTGAVYRQVLDFLAVPDDGRRDFAPINEAYQPRWRGVQSWHTRLDRYVKRSALGKLPLLNLLRPVSRALSRRNVQKVGKPSLRPEFRAELRETFAGDVELLGRLLGRDLSAWSADG